MGVREEYMKFASEVTRKVRIYRMHMQRSYAITLANKRRCQRNRHTIPGLVEAMLRVMVRSVDIHGMTKLLKTKGCVHNETFGATL